MSAQDYYNNQPQGNYGPPQGGNYGPQGGYPPQQQYPPQVRLQDPLTSIPSILSSHLRPFVFSFADHGNNRHIINPNNNNTTHLKIKCNTNKAVNHLDNPAVEEEQGRDV
jgi:hypothetical protein